MRFHRRFAVTAESFAEIHSCVTELVVKRNILKAKVPLVEAVAACVKNRHWCCAEISGVQGSSYLHHGD
jgi:hypothetical protein